MKLSVCAVGGGCEVYTHQLCNVCERTPYWKCRTMRKRVSGVVVSVLLTCCVKAIRYSTHSLLPVTRFKMEKPKNAEAAFFFFLFVA